jgi:hypothetical protein
MADRTAKPRLVAGLMLLLAAGGCQTPAGYISAAGKFAEAMGPTADAYRGYVETLDTLDATTTLRLAEIDPGFRVSPEALATGQTFSPEALDARLAAIEALLLYGKALAAAAGADPGGDFRAASLAIDEAGRRIGQVGGASGGLKPVGEAFGQIAGAIGQAVIEDRQAAAVRQAIIDAEPAVAATLAAMRSDVQVGRLLRLPSSARRLAAAAGAYNRLGDELGARFYGSPERDRSLAALRHEYEAYRALPLVEDGIIGLIDAADAADKALVRHARSRDKRGTIAEVVAAVDLLTARAREVADAIRALRG